MYGIKQKTRGSHKNQRNSVESTTLVTPDYPARQRFPSLSAY